MKFQMPPDITSADAEEDIGTTAVRRKLTTAHIYDCPGDKRWHRLTPREFQNRNADAQLPSISRNAGPDKVTANKNIQTSPDITNADAKAPTKPTKAHPYDCSRDKRGHCQASHYIQTRQVDHKQEHTTKKNSRRAIAKLQCHQHNRNKCR